MKTIMLAALTALTLGTGAAFADPAVNTQSNERPIVVAQAPFTIRQTANVELAYVTTTQSVSDAEWNQNQGALG